MDYPSIFDSITTTISNSRTESEKEKIAHDTLTWVCLYADGLQGGSESMEEHEFYYRMYFEVDKFREAHKVAMEIHLRRIAACEKLLPFLPIMKTIVSFANKYYNRSRSVPRIDRVWQIRDYWFEEEPVKFQFKFVPDPNDQASILLAIDYDRELIERTFYTDGETSFSIWDCKDEWQPPHEDDFVALGEAIEEFFVELLNTYGEV